MQKVNGQDVPESVEEGIAEVAKMIKQYADVVDKYADERVFMQHSHHFVGMNLRNNWGLWWHPMHTFPKPKIVEEFNALGIKHADDMSGILLTSAYRRHKGEPERIDEQVQHYIKYWQNKGVNLDD